VRARVRVGLGGIAWLVLLAAVPERGMMGEIDRLLLLGMLVTTPLAWELTSGDVPPALARVVRASFLPAALLAAVSFFRQPGRVAALLTTGWLAATALVGLAGLRVVLRGAATRRLPLDSLCVAAGRLYLPIGAGCRKRGSVSTPAGSATRSCS
jgi:hypothetical protein